MSNEELISRTDYTEKLRSAWFLFGLPKKAIESMPPISNSEELAELWVTMKYPTKLLRALIEEIEYEHIKRSKVELANHLIKGGQYEPKN